MRRGILRGQQKQKSPVSGRIGRYKSRGLRDKIQCQKLSRRSEYQSRIVRRFGDAIRFSWKHDIKTESDSTIRQTKQKTTLKTIAAENTSAWINGHLYFDEENMETIALALERAFDVNITIKDETLKK